MKLTDENQDYPDCMWPPRANNSIKLPPKIEKMLAEHEAKARAKNTAAAPATPETDR